LPSRYTRIVLRDGIAFSLALTERTVVVGVLPQRATIAVSQE
jgi:hypothetical protein